jgi:zinc transporter ZupT
MAIWQYIVLFSTVFLGGLSSFMFKDHSKTNLSLILSFSGAYIIGISALHLIPETFVGGDSKLGLWLLLGFFGQLALDQLSTGIEHGHIHVSHHQDRFFIARIMLGLGLHSYMEGLPLSIQKSSGGLEHIQLYWGIILHEIPAAFALVTLLNLSKVSKNTIILCLMLYAGMSSLGALSGQFLGWNTSHTKELMAVVIGTFLHISTTILFEADNSQHHNISWRKLLVIGGGLGIALMTMH